MTADEMTALMLRRRDGLARHDSLMLAADYADDCVLQSPGWGTVNGRQAIEKVFRAFFTAFPDCVFEFGDDFVVEDRAVQTMTVHGTNSGGFFGQAPTGKPFRLFLVALLTVSGRQVVHERRVYDIGGFMVQLATDGSTVEPAQLYKATLARVQADQEMRMAAEIQQALMPQALRQGIGYEVAASSRPCRAIGGDFIDYFNLPDGAFAFVLGDVAGKGPAAALLAAVLQGVFTANAYRCGPPATQMREANDALVRRGIDSRFATAVYAVLSPDGGLTYCNGGHNPALLIRRSGVQRLEEGGMVVGMIKDVTFEEQTIQLEPGDILVAFSDGITEARDLDGEEFGEERILACVDAHRELPPSALLQTLFEAVHDFSAGGTQADDLTVLVLTYSGTGVQAT
ncbi:MAG TPA: SpoIIE family protein phosphatase [Vicinamibacterales bacterium]|jgi:predicted ester cyclase|nr:SpoIIE family protein phosphatase [Vicinamibacterales bacterium]